MAPALATSASSSQILSQPIFRFESKSGGKGHQVRIHEAKDGSGAYLTCNCPGGRFAWAGGNGRGCWAMVRVRQALGWK